MNIYDFINSRDIAKYLKEINYEFSTIESAYIIEMADYVTLDEKINARQELLQTTEDCTVGGASLHGFLAEQCICAVNGNDTRHNAELFFSDIVLNISVPFKEGDILIARKYNDQELLQIENDRAFVLIGDCPFSDDAAFTSHGHEYRQNKGILGLEYAKFGIFLEVWHYMLDCEYYKMEQTLFNGPKRREKNLQLISDYVKGNIGEKKLRKIYRKIALETADAELKDFFQDLRENSIVSYKMRGNNQ